MTQPTAGINAGTFQRFAMSGGPEARVRHHGAQAASGPHFAVPPGDLAAGTFDGSYDAFADRLRDEMAPVGVLEDLLAARLIAAAWRLNEALCARDNGQLLDETLLEELESALGRAVATFERARSARRASWGHAVPSEAVSITFPFEDADDPDDEPASLADDLGWSRRFDPAPDVELEATEEDDDDSTDPSLLWRDRLVLDPSVSNRSPVVKGTWITVGQVVSLVVDGWSWADILRAHPELTEADIRACLTYSVEEEGSSGLIA